MRIEVYRVERWVGLQAPHAGSMRLKLAREGFQVNQWCDQPGTIYARHKHPESQTHWVISGELEISVPSGTYRLGPGDRDYMPADTLHTARVIGDEAVTYFVGIGERPEHPAPIKKKRGRPKKAEPSKADEADREFDRFVKMYGIVPGMRPGGDEQE